jgi:protein-arginine kinase activator protein McsA
MFDDLFSESELDIYSNVSLHGVDFTELSKTGVVEETIVTDEDGIVTKTISYESNDGKIKFVKKTNYLEPEANQQRNLELQELLTNAVKREDYTSAAFFKEKLNKLNK